VFDDSSGRFGVDLLVRGLLRSIHLARIDTAEFILFRTIRFVEH